VHPLRTGQMSARKTRTLQSRGRSQVPWAKPFASKSLGNLMTVARRRNANPWDSFLKNRQKNIIMAKMADRTGLPFSKKLSGEPLNSEEFGLAPSGIIEILRSLKKTCEVVPAPTPFSTPLGTFVDTFIQATRGVEKAASDFAQAARNKPLNSHQVRVSRIPLFRLNSALHTPRITSINTTEIVLMLLREVGNLEEWTPRAVHTIGSAFKKEAHLETFAAYVYWQFTGKMYLDRDNDTRREILATTFSELAESLQAMLLGKTQGRMERIADETCHFYEAKITPNGSTAGEPILINFETGLNESHFIDLFLNNLPWDFIQGTLAPAAKLGFMAIDTIDWQKNLKNRWAGLPSANFNPGGYRFILKNALGIRLL